MRYWLIFFLTFLACSATAETLKVHTSSANIRAEPLKNAEITGYLKRGAIVTPERWEGRHVLMHSHLDNQSGWVYAPAQ